MTRSTRRALLAALLPGFLLGACAEPRFFADENPQQLSQWNLFREQGDRLIPREQTMVFAPANPLFTDYAGKLRSMWLPPGGRAKLVGGELDLPVGSILSKTFYYAKGANGRLLETSHGVTELDRQQHRIIETRLLARRADGWQAMVYVWNDAQSEAFLRVAGASVPVSLQHPAGAGEFVYFRAQ